MTDPELARVAALVDRTETTLTAFEADVQVATARLEAKAATAPDHVVLDDSDDLGLDDPFTQYAVEVTYPADHGSEFAEGAAGRTVRLRVHASRNEEARLLAEHRAKRHRELGAASAVVVERTWTPTRWWPTRTEGTS